MYNALSSKVAFDNLESSLSGRLSVYPTLANAVTLTGHADAWTLSAAYIEVVPVSTITSDIFLDSILIESVSAADSFQVVIATGAAGHEVVTAGARFTPVANNAMPIIIPIRRKILANTRIAMKVANKAGASAKTADVSITYRLVA